MSADTVLTIGRLLLGGLFVAAALRHFFLMRETAVEMIAARGVPMPRLTMYAGSAFELVAGLFLMAGYFVPVAAAALIVFTIAASVMLLNFWDMEGPPRDGMVSAWMSNIGVIGGLVIAAAVAL